MCMSMFALLMRQPGGAVPMQCIKTVCHCWAACVAFASSDSLYSEWILERKCDKTNKNCNILSELDVILCRTKVCQGIADN